MIEFKYRLEPADLDAYRRLITRRIETSDRDGGAQWWSWTLYTIVAAAVFGGISVLFASLAGRQLSLLEFTLGLIGGVAATLVMMWLRYARYSRRAVRPDGPTLSEHTLSVSEDGVRLTSPIHEALYRWAAIEQMTSDDRIIVLWLEPGGGVIVPRRALPEHGSQTAFVDAVRAQLAKSKTTSAAAAQA